MFGITDVEGRLTYVNPTWENVLGFSTEELVAQHYANFVHPQDREATLAKAQRTAQGESAVSFENRYQTKNGDYCWIAWNVSASPEENQTYIIGEKISADRRTQLKQQQAEIKAQIAEGATKLARKMKGDFLAVVSHELRSPLYPILGWTQLLKRDSLSKEKATLAVDAIERNAKLQLKLVEDLLDVAQLSRGQVRLANTVVQLGKVITAALENHWLIASEKGIKIKTVNLEKTSTVRGDNKRLQQVVSILLSNALTFTPEDGRITVTLSNEAENACITVADTGRGISSDFAPYVFEAFQQADYSKTRKVGGLGAGLTIAQQLVEMHGGTISVESPGIGKGSTFTVKLPLA